MKYILRNYEDNDYKFIYDIKKSAYKDYVEKHYGPWKENEQIKFFDDYIKKQSNFIKIIVLDNKSIGFVDISVIDNICEINNICIDEKYRGQGIGTQILNDCLNKHKDKDIKLQYFKSNRVGNLYKRLGFKEIGETKTHYQMVKKR